jgi:DNA helicase-2/ATP-dependent DNA helicase PcrA
MAQRAQPDYLNDLNPEQREAVVTLDGPVLVLAGAGTGKTRVLTTRIAHILATGRARPSEILSVTFTNKAAREMKERVGRMVGQIVEGMPWLGTFHSIGVKVLRRHAELVGLKTNFTILDTDDQIRLMKQLIAAENLDEKRWPGRVLAQLIDSWKNRGLTPEQVPAGEGASFGGGKGKKLYTAYQERLKTLNAADFGDLLLECIRLFRTHPEVLRQYQNRFRYILVDEYQDTNVAQYLWLRLLGQSQSVPAPVQRTPLPSPLEGEGGDERSEEPVEGFAREARRDQEHPSPASPLRGSAPSLSRGEGAEPAALSASTRLQQKNICCVGDDDQSIYGWRGAEVGNILRFEKDFPGAQVIRLEQNYRSTPHILAAASGVIAANEKRLGKTLWTEVPAGEKVRLIGHWDGEEEARWIGEEIEALGRGTRRLAPVPHDDVAILVRASFQMRAFEDRFLTIGLPYRVIGGPRFYERQEIRDAMAYFRVAVSPDDGLAFERIVNVPKRGLGDKAVQEINLAAREAGVPLLEGARLLADTSALPARSRAGLRQLVAGFDRWHAAVREGRDHVALAEAILDESGYTDMWKAEKSPDAAGRLENLKELVKALGEFDNLQGFLEHVDVLTPPGLYGGGYGAASPGRSTLAENVARADVYNSPGWKRMQARAAERGVAQPREARTMVIDAGAAAAYAVGTRVFHQKFGYGNVTAVEGDKLAIDFDKAGPKNVVARFVTAADEVPF